MADSLDLLDLLLSGSEYCNLTDHLNICLENPKSYYIKHDLHKCSAPNKYFEVHQELLYTKNIAGEKECLLNQSYKNGLSIEDTVIMSPSDMQDKEKVSLDDKN